MWVKLWKLGKCLDYPDDIVFILNNQTYLVIHNSKDNQNTLPSTKIEEADNWVETFLNNKNNTVTRKKINTLLEIKVQSSQEFYLTFLYKENSFRQILTLEWEYKEILKDNFTGRFPEGFNVYRISRWKIYFFNFSPTFGISR